MHVLFSRNGFASPARNQVVEGFGPLLPDPAGILDLPAGFRYTVVARQGDRMSDGLLMPGQPDGMAAFAGPDGTTVLVCNHELNPATPELGPFGEDYALLSKLDPALLYDAGHLKTPGMGGTTTLVYDTRSGKLLRSHLSLAGTERNCAGGPTPWDSWISCEETTAGVDELHETDHGWNFEVPSGADGPVRPLPLKAMGRFNHEAIAVDPASGAVYETEDRPDGLIYRFLPKTPGALAEGGRLQALVIRDQAACDTRNWGDGPAIACGDRFAVAWMDLAETDAPKDDLRLRGFAGGAARFARGEGMWHGNGAIYFACTNGGAAKKGQIWKYTPSAAEGTAGESASPGTLELFVEPNDGGLVDNADNLTVAPWGDLIVCEDGSGEQFLVGVTPDGGIYKFGRNAMASNSELAGATFAPDGSTLFVNVQHAGLTLAITGPWRSARA
jgi:secreted PhoX family phosphatase